MSEILNAQESRRSALVRGATFAAVGLTAASLFIPAAAHAAIPSSIPGTGNFQVLNFALQLEDLEANLYAQALARLTTGGVVTGAAAGVGHIPGLSLATTELDVKYIQQFASVEAAHRDYLKAALTPANAITTLKPATYDFGISTMTRQQVLDLVLEAEATGVQAYLGAIPSFVNLTDPATRGYLATAAAIQGTEARHTSVLTIVRNILSSQGIVLDPIASVAPLKGDPGTTPTATSYVSNTPNLGTPEGRDLAMDPQEVLNRVSGFIQYL